MRITFSVLLLLLALPAAFTQAAAQQAAPLAPVQAPPVPNIVSGAPAAVEPTRAEVHLPAEEVRVQIDAEETTATGAVQRQNRSYYFVLGALVALVAVLVFAL